MQAHPRIPHPHESLNDRVGDRIDRIFGSMRTFWALVIWQFGWMALATFHVPPFERDPYPYTFLLFLGNLVQLFALPVLGNTSNRADAKRSAKADTDHEALSYLAHSVDAIKTHLGIQE